MQRGKAFFVRPRVLFLWAICVLVIAVSAQDASESPALPSVTADPSPTSVQPTPESPSPTVVSPSPTVSDPTQTPTEVSSSPPTSQSSSQPSSVPSTPPSSASTSEPSVSESPLPSQPTPQPPSQSQPQSTGEISTNVDPSISRGDPSTTRGDPSTARGDPSTNLGDPPQITSLTTFSNVFTDIFTVTSRAVPEPAPADPTPVIAPQPAPQPQPTQPPPTQPAGQPVPTTVAPRRRISRTQVMTFTSNGVPHVTTTVIVEEVDPTPAPGNPSSSAAPIDSSAKAANTGKKAGVIIGGVLGGLFSVAILGLVGSGAVRWRKQMKEDAENGVFGRRRPMGELFGVHSKVLRSEASAVSGTHDRVDTSTSHGSPSLLAPRTESPYDSTQYGSLSSQGNAAYPTAGLAAMSGQQMSYAYSPFGAHPAPVVHDVLPVSAPPPTHYASTPPEASGKDVGGFVPTNEYAPQDTNTQAYQQQIALMDFSPMQADEIEIAKGDTVHISQMYSDGWCSGINLRTGREGAFPSTVLASGSA